MFNTFRIGNAVNSLAEHVQYVDYFFFNELKDLPNAHRFVILSACFVNAE